MEVGYECEPGAGKPAYPKIVAAVVLSFSEMRSPHFVVAWESFRSRGAYSASGLHRELNRVKERSQECMAR